MKQDVLERLCAEDWAKIGKELVAHAVWRAGTYWWRYGRQELAQGTEPKDIVQEVIKRTFAGACDARTAFRRWNPEKGPLLPWLKDQVNSLLDALAKSAANRHECRFTPESNCDESETGQNDVESCVVDQSLTSLDGLLVAEEQERVKNQVGKLFEAINDDEELVEMVDAIMAGHGPEPRFLAERLGVSPASIYNRAKRLYRYAVKVVKP